ncbi:MAG: hypothetical protein EOO10_13775 [Chitinophagaceae bacterium]|nr:MAG: hypothetical protein EOO10_13775 [Chitinophagaceae bacterium]
MLIGINANGERSHPAQKGETGTCPFCGQPLKAAFGEIYAKHWRHVRVQECDSWQEGETDWHLCWKNNFPKEWQEVILVKGGEKHIADVLTADGLIIEFQNSSITPETIRIREQFYQNMVWIVNAQSFEQSFQMQNLEEEALQALRQTMETELQVFRSKYADRLRFIDLEIERLQTKQQYSLQSLTREKSALQGIQNQEGTVKEYGKRLNDAMAIIDASVEEGSNLFTIEFDYYQKVIPYQREVAKAEEELKSIQDKVKELKNATDCMVQNFTYKDVPYSLLNPENFAVVKVLQKDKANTMFVELESIPSRTAFYAYQYKQEATKFLIPSEQTAAIWEKELQDVEAKWTEAKAALSAYNEKAKRDMADSATFVGERLIKSIALRESAVKQLFFEEQTYLRDKEKIQLEAAKEEVAILAKQQSTVAMEAEKIKSELSGKFSYYWKRERTCWQEAKRPVYFDMFGQLYKRINECTFQVVSYESILLETGAIATEELSANGTTLS